MIRFRRGGIHLGSLHSATQSLSIVVPYNGFALSPGTDFLLMPMDESIAGKGMIAPE
jgi:hypothetical protein